MLFDFFFKYLSRLLDGWDNMHINNVGMKEKFYLMMYSTHLQLYDIRHKVDSENGNPLLPLHGLLFPKLGSFICSIPQAG